LNRILLAFRCFFDILFHGELSAGAMTQLRLTRRPSISTQEPAVARKPAPAPPGHTTDGPRPRRGSRPRPAPRLEVRMADI
jgi:hypothetical protein